MEVQFAELKSEIDSNNSDAKNEINAIGILDIKETETRSPSHNGTAIICQMRKDHLSSPENTQMHQSIKNSKNSLKTSAEISNYICIYTYIYIRKRAVQFTQTTYPQFFDY